MKIKDLIEEAGYEPMAYTGKAMYGRHCVGVVVEDMFALIALLIETARDRIGNKGLGVETQDLDDLCDVLYYTCYDRSGYEYILYWPKEDYVQETEAPSKDEGS